VTLGFTIPGSCVTFLRLKKEALAGSGLLTVKMRYVSFDEDDNGL
jgi:hypothetical protein